MGWTESSWCQLELSISTLVLVCLPSLQYRKGKIGEYYDCQIYIDLSEPLIYIKQFGGENMAVSIWKFNQCSIALPWLHTYPWGVEHLCWVLSVPIFAIEHILDVRYLNGGSAPTSFRYLLLRQIKVLFRCKKSSFASSHLTNFWTFTGVADKQIAVVEDLFIGYGRHYTLFLPHCPWLYLAWTHEVYLLLCVP